MHRASPLAIIPPPPHLTRVSRSHLFLLYVLAYRLALIATPVSVRELEQGYDERWAFYPWCIGCMLWLEDVLSELGVGGSPTITTSTFNSRSAADDAASVPHSPINQGKQKNGIHLLVFSVCWG